MINRSKSSFLKTARNLYTKKIDSESMSRYELVQVLFSTEATREGDYAKLYSNSFPSEKSIEDKTKGELHQMIDVQICSYISHLLSKSRNMIS